MASVIAIVFLITLIALFGIFLVWGTAKLGPKIKQSSLKKSSYECGIEVQQSGHTKVPVKFYLTAILFILFDIEIIFMYPWAISFGDAITNGYGAQVLAAMGVFILVFIIGLLWEMKSKALEWE